MMGKFQYHYSKGHRKAIAAVAIVVIIILAAGFAYYYNLLPKAGIDQTANRSGITEGTTAEQNTTNITGNATEQPVVGPIPNATNETNTTQNATQNTTQPPATTATQGLTAQYFTTTNLAGDVIATKVVPSLDFAWSDINQPADGVAWNRFSARFSGVLLIEKEGDYTLIITSDDGSRLYVDGTNVADIWESTGVTSKSTFRKLTAGEHTIRVEYRNIGGGSAKLKLEYWASAQNVSRQVIPSGMFRP